MFSIKYDGKICIALVFLVYSSVGPKDSRVPVSLGTYVPRFILILPSRFLYSIYYRSSVLEDREIKIPAGYSEPAPILFNCTIQLSSNRRGEPADLAELPRVPLHRKIERTALSCIVVAFLLPFLLPSTVFSFFLTALAFTRHPHTPMYVYLRTCTCTLV